jgi:hypothetical protein
MSLNDFLPDLIIQHVGKHYLAGRLTKIGIYNNKYYLLQELSKGQQISPVCANYELCN